MGSSFNRQFMPTWTHDAGSLKAHGTAVVWADCNAAPSCKSRVVDLDKVIARHGPRYSFWNRRSACPKGGCRGPVTFRAVPGNGAWQIQMHGDSTGLAEILHQRWKASLPADLRDTLPVIPMLQATGNYVLIGCGTCDLRPVYVGAVQGLAWGGMSMNEVTAHMRLQCSRSCEMVLEMVAADLVPAEDR